ncbi:MAG: YerC/YecD family TrpR-related protein [bacterium]|nr:YerC/YecD family TrpR-related protein [bacterium]
MKRLYLEKVKRLEKLSKEKQEDLVFDLVNAMVTANSLADAALFIQDLLTRSEVKILSKRLRIAKLLLSGMTYEAIEKDLHVSHGTVAKIAAWLTERGDGFRNIVKKLPKQKTEKHWTEYSDWEHFKRKHPLYFWPELLLEEVIKTANKRQKERIREVLDRVEEKNELHKRIEKLFHS